MPSYVFTLRFNFFSVRKIKTKIVLLKHLCHCDTFHSFSKIYAQYFTQNLVRLYIPIHCRLEYDEKTGRAKNAKGVTTRVPDFGNTTAIEWLDPYLHGPAIYFYPFVDSLCRLLGYERGKSLRAAPYDFRYDPCKLQKNSACTRKNLVSIYLLLILEPFVPIPVIENKIDQKV